MFSKVVRHMRIPPIDLLVKFTQMGVSNIAAQMYTGASSLVRSRRSRLWRVLNVWWAGDKGGSESHWLIFKQRFAESVRDKSNVKPFVYV